MSRNLSDSKHERSILNRIARLEQQVREKGTTQIQGIDTVQIAYTDDQVLHLNVAPNSGLIGTFVFSLQYDNPQPDDVVFGDVDIAVNHGTDEFGPLTTLNPYLGTLRVEAVNDLYFGHFWAQEQGYFPVVKTVKLYTAASGAPQDFYIHYRWRYVGVGKVLQAATGDITILP